MLRDTISDTRHGSAIHEAGHAAFAWHFSTRNITNPPFDEIRVDSTLNEVGDVYGHVDVHWDRLQIDLITRCAITLAGIFCKECVASIQPIEWVELLNDRNGTDGTDDFAEAYNLAKDNSQSWETFATQALQRLKGATAIGTLVSGIADLAIQEGIVPITNLELRTLLQSYK